MTTTKMTRIEAPHYVPAAGRDRLPREIWRLDDGRLLAAYADGTRHLFASRVAFREVHPCTALELYPDATPEPIEAPPLPETIAVAVDWAEIDSLMSEIDRARQGTDLGRSGVHDAFGGTYSPTFHARTLAGLVRLVDSVSAIAEHVWSRVHAARLTQANVADVRRACRVAIACSRAFAALHRMGLIDDPSTRICGTGEGYGLTGLAWFAGASIDHGVSSAAVERFAAGGELEELP